uniref:Uncharacterized protein n=1 Tax=Magnetococcus massalia (strain MO-1) TaxID=451514 RepID=A0A1S7LK11_MAGMO|nr:protein of unknown function [Candidatus Magnetococcus massalia]
MRLVSKPVVANVGQQIPVVTGEAFDTLKSLWLVDDYSAGDLKGHPMFASEFSQLFGEGFKALLLAKFLVHFQAPRCALSLDPYSHTIKAPIQYKTMQFQ